MRTVAIVISAAALLAIPALWVIQRQSTATATGTPERIAETYMKALYAQDQRAAYRWISEKDRKYKSEREYLRENPPFSGRALELTRELADMIEWNDVRAEIGGNEATVRFKVKLPNSSAPEIQKLFFEFDASRLAQLTEKEKVAIVEQLRLMNKQGVLPKIDAEDSLKLVKEQENWRLLADWAQAIPVKFTAEVKEGLAWEFRPVQETVLAKPGATLQALYKVKNLSDRTLTAKARHRDEPKDLADKYLEVIQCFCFIQQTLAPGEEKELPLVFRVGWDVPKDIGEFRIKYEFYPIEKFPKT